MDSKKLYLIDKLSEISEQLGWQMLAVATMDGDLPGVVIGTPEFINNMEQILQTVDKALEATIKMEEKEEVPKSRLQPKKDDDDPTFH